MKQLKNLFLLVLLGILWTSCGDDVNCQEPNIDQNWATELAAAISTGNAFYAEETPENCEAYKNALNAYIDVLQDYKGCAEETGQGPEFQDSIDDARNEIDINSC